MFLVLSLTDALDGYLARRLKLTSDLGKLIDPIADKILVISALIGLVELRSVSSIPVMIFVARDFAVSAFRMSKAKEGRIIGAGPLGKLKTVVQIIAILMLILGVPFGVLALWLAVILSLVSGADYIVRG